MIITNKVILMGNLTRDPEIKQGNTKVARFSIGIRRKTKDNQADFPNIVAFGHNAEFAEKYLHKGSKVAIVGWIKTGNYTNRDGLKVYTTDVVAEEFEFAENKSATTAQNTSVDDTVPIYTDNEVAPVKKKDAPMPKWMKDAEDADEELPFS